MWYSEAILSAGGPLLERVRIRGCGVTVPFGASVGKLFLCEVVSFCDREDSGVRDRVYRYSQLGTAFPGYAVPERLASASVVRFGDPVWGHISLPQRPGFTGSPFHVRG